MTTSWIDPNDAAAICAINRRITTVLGHLSRWHERNDHSTTGMTPRQAADDALEEIDQLTSDLGTLRGRIATEAEAFDAVLDAKIATVFDPGDNQSRGIDG